jgi:hypothetical protein
MPRVKRTRAAASFMVKGRPLGPVAREDIIAALGSDRKEAIHETEAALAVYVEGRPHLEKRPRPAHYVAEFEPVRQMSLELLRIIHGWSDFYRGEFEPRGADIHAIEQSVCRLYEVASSVVETKGTASTRGAPSNEALNTAIYLLHVAFQRAYVGPREARRRKRGVEALSEQEARELRYLRAALTDARIIRADTTDDRLARLRRDALRAKGAK